MANTLQDQGKLEEALKAYQLLSQLSLIMPRLISTWVML